MINRVCASILLLFMLAGVALAADNKALSDDAIVDAVRIRLAADADVKGGAMNVECKSGVVTITGQADSNKSKDKATKLARKVKGVKQVVNELVVGEKPAVK